MLFDHAAIVGETRSRSRVFAERDDQTGYLGPQINHFLRLHGASGPIVENTSPRVIVAVGNLDAGWTPALWVAKYAMLTATTPTEPRLRANFFTGDLQPGSYFPSYPYLERGGGLQSEALRMAISKEKRTRRPCLRVVAGVPENNPTVQKAASSIRGIQVH